MSHQDKGNGKLGGGGRNEGDVVGTEGGDGGRGMYARKETGSGREKMEEGLSREELQGNGQ